MVNKLNQDIMLACSRPNLTTPALINLFLYSNLELGDLAYRFYFEFLKQLYFRLSFDKFGKSAYQTNHEVHVFVQGSTGRLFHYLGVS